MVLWAGVGRGGRSVGGEGRFGEGGDLVDELLMNYVAVVVANRNCCWGSGSLHIWLCVEGIVVEEMGVK